MVLRNKEGSVFPISAHNGTNIDKLTRMIVGKIHNIEPKSNCIITQERHRLQVLRALSALQSIELQTEVWMQNIEITALELRIAADAIGNITGSINNEEILGQIFSIFCIGK